MYFSVLAKILLCMCQALIYIIQFEAQLVEPVGINTAGT